MCRYTVTKMLQIMAVQEIGDIIRKDPFQYSHVIVNCLSPGVCKSDFNREAEDGISGRTMKYGTALVQLTARSAEVGSRTLVAGLTAGEGSMGAFMEDSKIAMPSKFVRSEEGWMVRKRMWMQLLQRLEIIHPGI